MNLSYRYDRQGNKIEEAYGKQEITGDGEPLGWHKIHFAYDSNNHLVEVKDDFGARMRYDYDCLGNPVLEERVIEEGVIQRIRYGYNKNGWKIRKTEEIRGNGDLKTAVTRYGYDENGNLNWIKTPKGFEIRRNYDGDDRLIEERVLDKRNGIDRKTCYAYDAAGNLLSVTVKGTEKGEELRSGYQYDLKDRLTHRIGQNQAVTRYLYTLTTLEDELIFGATDLLEAGMSEKLVISELERNYKMFDALNNNKKAEIEAGTLEPLKYNREEIEKVVHEKAEQLRKQQGQTEDEEIKSTNC